MLVAWDDVKKPDEDVFDFHPDIHYVKNTEDPMQTLWLSCPRGAKNFPTVVWFHGGGMAVDGHEYPAVIYNGKCAVVEARYRISPQVKAPAYHEDAAAAIAWVLKHIAEYGGRTDRVFVGGMSAGSYLAAITCMSPGWLSPYGYSHKNIAGLILISGQMTTHFQIKADLEYPGDGKLPVIDELAPLAHLSADLPPILMVTGESALDIPVRAEENALMCATLKAMGHPAVEHYVLGGHNHGGALDGSNYLVGDFLERHG
jgi:acetyl esterase/lipase